MEISKYTLTENLEMVAVGKISITDFCIQYENIINENRTPVLKDVDVFLSELKNYDLNRKVNDIGEIFEMKLYKDRFKLYEKHKQDLPLFENKNPDWLINKIEDKEYLHLNEFRQEIDFDTIQSKPIERIRNLKHTIKNIPSQPQPETDKDNTALIDNSNAKATEKIIYLKELGILDFLIETEPFNLSTNAIANVLSSITGEKAGTLQSYLNPIKNPTAGQKNNPLNNTKNVDKVKQTLIKLGFNPS